MNHVHLGIDVNAARNWTEEWVKLEVDLSLKAAVAIATIVKNEVDPVEARVIALQKDLDVLQARIEELAKSVG